MYVSLMFYSITTVNYSSQAPLMFISCYFFHKRKELHVSGMQVLKKHVKASVIENLSRKKIQSGFKNIQISKTLTFVGHCYQYYEL